jgi:hypothetical protein
MYIADIHGLRLTIFLPNQLTHVMIWIHDSRQQSCILVPKAKPQLSARSVTDGMPTEILITSIAEYQISKI